MMGSGRCLCSNKKGVGLILIAKGGNNEEKRQKED